MPYSVLKLEASLYKRVLLNNLGPGLNEVGLNYAGLDDGVKWILCFAMLLGRLEIFTLLVLLTPAFWKR